MAMHKGVENLGGEEAQRCPQAPGVRAFDGHAQGALSQAYSPLGIIRSSAGQMYWVLSAAVLSPCCAVWAYAIVRVS
eukprot:106081-Chlamydomonas_euryale.AAC.4